MREALLFALVCFGSFFLGRFSLFNFRAVIVTAAHHETISPSEKRHALLGAAFVLLPFVLASMLFGLSLFFIKIFVFVLFFTGGLLLAVHSDLLLYNRSPALYEEQETVRMREEFFFWLALLVLIFIMAIFVFI